jgi:hypothetical protein
VAADEPRKKLKRQMKRNDRRRGTTGKEEEMQTTRTTGRDMTTKKIEEKERTCPNLKWVVSSSLIKTCPLNIHVLINKWIRCGRG